MESQTRPVALPGAANPLEVQPGYTHPADLQSLADLDKLLDAIRQYLDMDVAFTARFMAGRRCVERVSLGPGAATPHPLTPASSDPLDDTFCGKIVAGQLDALTRNCRQHPLARQLRVTDQYKIGAYIGVPIVLASGQVYGTLCCFDHQPNPTLTEKDVELLHRVAGYIGNVVGRLYARQQANEHLLAAVTAVLEQRQLNVVFQPVYCREAGGFAYCEALARFTPQPYRPPNEWLHDAAVVGLELQVEQAIVSQVVQRIEQAQRIGHQLVVAINASPRLIVSGLLPQLLTDVAPHQVRIELTEHEQIENYQQFRQCLRPLSQRGFKICIDDVGAGFASLKHILELEPDVIKLDLSLAHNIHHDRKRQALITGLLAFASSFACQVVAEGVETAAEYRALRELGVCWFQGWYFARPLEFDQLLSAEPPACANYSAG